LAGARAGPGLGGLHGPDVASRQTRRRGTVQLRPSRCASLRAPVATYGVSEMRRLGLDQIVLHLLQGRGDCTAGRPAPGLDGVSIGRGGGRRRGGANSPLASRSPTGPRSGVAAWRHTADVTLALFTTGPGCGERQQPRRAPSGLPGGTRGSAARRHTSRAAAAAAAAMARSQICGTRSMTNSTASMSRVVSAVRAPAGGIGQSRPRAHARGPAARPPRSPLARSSGQWHRPLIRSLHGQ